MAAGSPLPGFFVELEFTFLASASVCAGTSVSTPAACASVEGSVVHAAARGIDERVVPDSLHIGHPLGAMRVDVQGRCEASRPLAFEALGFARTARRLMDGTAWVPRSVLDPA